MMGLLGFGIPGSTDREAPPAATNDAAQAAAAACWAADGSPMRLSMPHSSQCYHQQVWLTKYVVDAVGDDDRRQASAAQDVQSCVHREQDERREEPYGRRVLECVVDRRTRTGCHDLQPHRD